MNITPKTLTVEQLAQELNISRASAYTLVKRKDFPKIRIGKRIIIPTLAFETWLMITTDKD